MEETEIVRRTRAWVRQQLPAEAGGHGWRHVERVWATARQLAAVEGGEPLVVELAALLHDIADWKFSDGDLEAGPRAAAAWLNRLKVDSGIRDRVCAIVRAVSFRGAAVEDRMESLEGKIVQDADRLDALGAIGIARAFAYGGLRGRPLYDPEERPVQHRSFASYRGSQSATITHFHEKLMLLADRMHTDTARRLARRRHAFMEGFLRRFEREWHGQA